MATNWTKVEYNIATGHISGASSAMGPVFKIIRKIRKRTENLRGLYSLIADDFYRTNEKLIFSDTGVRFEDLSDKTKYNKAMAIGEVYPILVGSTGDLRESLTNRLSRNAVQNISGKSMRIQSKVPYSGYHQDGTRFMPARPPIDMKDETRLRRWANMASAWALKDLGVKI